MRSKLLLAQVWLMLGWMHAAVMLLPFKRLTCGLCQNWEPMTVSSLNTNQKAQAKELGWLVGVAARATPWQSRCLIQVLVLQRLLERRGLPGKFYLGVCRGSELAVNPTDMFAHAWLQCGEEVINGSDGHEQFTVVSVFSWGLPSV
jgi:hypothetical protein